MANNFSEEALAALLKSIEITKEDAKFNKDDPPLGIFSPIKMENLKEALLTFDPDYAYEKILSIESNRDTLKKELKYMLTAVFSNSKKPNINFLIPLFIKYEIGLPVHHPEIYFQSSMKIFFIFTLIFPDIVYSLQKKNLIPQFKPPPILDIYKNFKPLHRNAGIFGLLPKGKKYGGFVKALIHIEMNQLVSGFAEEILALCRSLYNSSITPHDKREIWFTKLEISESDCLAWSKTFDILFPEHNNIHKYFGQTV